MFTFFLISIALALTPGPDNIYLLNTAMQKSKTYAATFMFGLCSGLVIHTALTIIGISSIIAADKNLFTVLQIFGACYLLYLGVTMLRKTSSTKEKNLEYKVNGSIYIRGVIMNLSNPKVLLFFLSFFPQFIDPSHDHRIWQSIYFGAVFILATLIAFSSIIFLAHLLSNALNSNRFRVLLNRSTAAIFIVLAISILL